MTRLSTGAEPALVEQVRAAMGRRYKPDTIYNVGIAMGQFFAVCPPGPSGYTAQDLTDYLGRLGDRVSPYSLPTITAELRLGFRALHWRWPVEDADLGFVRRGARNQEGGVVLDEEDIRVLIASVKDHPAEGWQRALVFLSTVYGFRRMELAEILAEGITLPIIDVQTKKGGRRRHHTVPQEFWRFLTFPSHAVNRNKLHREFQAIMERLFGVLEDGVGTHAVRRSLVTGLLDNGATIEQVIVWMGWSRHRGPIALTYYRPEERNVDAFILERHPFLQYWR